MRFSLDVRHLVFLNKQDDTVHVLALQLIASSDPGSTGISSIAFYQMASCFTHSPHLSLHDPFTVRSVGNGSVVILRCRDSKLILLALLFGDEGGNGLVLDYLSESQRAQSIVCYLENITNSQH